MSKFTNSQLDAIKAAIQSNSTFWRNDDQAESDDVISEWFNQPADTPAVSVWKALVSRDEVNAAVNWTEFASLGTGAVNVFAAIVRDSFSAVSSNVRAGLAEALGVESLSWAAVEDVLMRPGTRLEVLFSTQSGAARVTEVYGMRLDPYDVSEALKGVR